MDETGVRMVGKRFKPHSHKNIRRRVRPTIERSLEIIYWLSEQRSSTRWKKLRALVRKCHPMCAGTDCTYIAKSVHHVKSAAKYPDSFYDMSNLVPLCYSCHADVSELERVGHLVQSEELYSDKAKAIAYKYFDSLMD